MAHPNLLVAQLLQLVASKDQRRSSRKNRLVARNNKPHKGLAVLQLSKGMALQPYEGLSENKNNLLTKNSLEKKKNNLPAANFAV